MVWTSFRIMFLNKYWSLDSKFQHRIIWVNLHQEGKTLFAFFPFYPLQTESMEILIFRLQLGVVTQMFVENNVFPSQSICFKKNKYFCLTNFFRLWKTSVSMILRKFLFLKDFEPYDSYKKNSYKNNFYKGLHTL